MFVEFANIVSERHDVPSETVDVIIFMVLVPIFWILRGFAIVGILYPITRLIFVLSSRNKIGDLIIAFFWSLINIFILLSDISLFWKWLWIDMLGLFIAITVLFSWNIKLAKKKSENIFIRKK